MIEEIRFWLAELLLDWAMSVMPRCDGKRILAYGIERYVEWSFKNHLVY